MIILSSAAVPRQPPEFPDQLACPMQPGHPRPHARVWPDAEQDLPFRLIRTLGIIVENAVVVGEAIYHAARTAPPLRARGGVRRCDFPCWVGPPPPSSHFFP